MWIAYSGLQTGQIEFSSRVGNRCLPLLSHNNAFITLPKNTSFFAVFFLYIFPRICKNGILAKSSLEFKHSQKRKNVSMYFDFILLYFHEFLFQGKNNPKMLLLARKKMNPFKLNVMES